MSEKEVLHVHELPYTKMNLHPSKIYTTVKNTLYSTSQLLYRFYSAKIILQRLIEKAEFLLAKEKASMAKKLKQNNLDV